MIDYVARVAHFLPGGRKSFTRFFSVLLGATAISGQAEKYRTCKYVE